MERSGVYGCSVFGHYMERTVWGYSSGEGREGQEMTAPEWMTAYGSVHYICEWKGMQVWAGQDLVDLDFWITSGQDVLVHPRIAEIFFKDKK